MARTRIRDRARPAVLARLERLYARTVDPGSRQTIFRGIRRADDRHDTFTREFFKKQFDIEIGRYTYGGYQIDGSIVEGTRIGSFCSIAGGVRIGGTNHPLGYVSTHPFLYLANRGFVDRNDDELLAEGNAPVVIEDDVWLGSNAVVLPGCRVGRGAVVAAGAVVTRDVGPYEIVAGVPARVIRRRFDEQRAARLAAIDWPSWSDEEIRERLGAFYDVEAFVERFGPAADPADPA